MMRIDVDEQRVARAVRDQELDLAELLLQVAQRFSGDLPALASATATSLAVWRHSQPAGPAAIALVQQMAAALEPAGAGSR